MTKEEAVKRMKTLRLKIDPPTTNQLGWLETWIYKEDMEALEMAIKALEQTETIKEIPKDYKYDTETEDFLVYRHKYTGHEIHIEKPVPTYRIENEE